MDNNKKDRDEFDFKGLLRYYLRRWWWFALCLAFFCTGAALYLNKKHPTFLNKGLLMINQEEQVDQGAVSSTLMNFINGGGAVNAEDQQMKLTSHTALKRAVEMLDLNKTYWRSNGFFKRRTNYFQNSPFRVDIPREILDTLTATTVFKITGPEQGPWHIKAKQTDLNDSYEVADAEVKAFPYAVHTPYGTFTVTKTGKLPALPGLKYNCIVMGTPAAVADLQKKFGVNYLSPRADAFEVSMEDGCAPRGRAIVNLVMEQFNKDKDADRADYNAQVLQSVEERLLALYKELEQGGREIESFKSANNMTEPEAEAQYILTRKGTVEEQRTAALAEMEANQMIQDMLTKPGQQFDMIPFAGGKGYSAEFNTQIADYNKLILERTQLLTSAKENSAPIRKVEAQINAMRANLLTSVARDLDAKRIAFRNMESDNSKSDSRIKQIPAIERQLTRMYRDREVKNLVYSYLLSRREELILDAARQQPLGKIIDAAYTDIEPIAPKGKLIWAIAVFFGLGLPAVILYFFGLRRKEEASEASPVKP